MSVLTVSYYKKYLKTELKKIMYTLTFHIPRDIQKGIT